MSERLNLPARHREHLEALLREHLPDVEVWAYGSRVDGRSHDGSDLDLVLRGAGLEEIDLTRLADFQRALNDSTIPFVVEARDWARLPERFHREIEREYVEVAVLSRDTDGCPETLYRPRFPRHWRRRSLYSLATWVNGIAFRDIQSTRTGMPVIKIAEIKGGITRQTKFTHQTFDESVRVGPGDLLFSWSGQPEESIDAFVWRGPEGWLNQHVFRVTTASCVDPTFFLFLLRYLRRHFVGIARNKQTTGLGHVTKQDLKELEAAVPPLWEQRAIAHILGTLDDKIELNRRMNETLEAMARALFKSWFVDFDPVRAKMEGRDTGLPRQVADLFPDRLVDSELGPIPEGWRAGTLADVAHLNPESWGRKNTPGGVRYVDLANTKWGFIESVKPYAWGLAPSRARRVLRPGDTIVGTVRPGNGSFALVDRDGLTGSTGFAVLRPKAAIEREVVYCAATFQSNIDRLARLADGGAYPAVNPTTVLDTAVVLPEMCTRATFSELTAPLLNQRRENQREARILAPVRDALLPKLVSGEIRLHESVVEKVRT